MNKKARILLYSSNIWFFGEGLLGPLFAVFSQKIGGNVLDIAWAWAVYLVVSGVFEIGVGKLSDSKIDKTKLMIAGYILNAAATFGYLMVSNQLQFFALQVALGVAAALATPTWQALYAKYADKDHDGYAWGLADGDAKIITGVSAVLGGVIVSTVGFSWLFFIMGLLQTFAALMQAFILKDKNIHDPLPGKISNKFKSQVPNAKIKT